MAFTFNHARGEEVMIIAAVINLKKYRQSPITVLPHMGPFKVQETYTYPAIHIDPKSFLEREGVFGIEWYCTKEKSKVQAFSTEQPKLSGFSGYQRPVLFSTDKKDLKNMDVYYISSKKPSIFPFSMVVNRSPWSELNKLIQPHIEDQKVFIQLIAQAQESNRWVDVLQKDYDLYLRGISHPASFYPVRMLQEKLIEFTEKHEGWHTQNPIIQDLEQKLQEQGYRTVIRLAIHGGSSKANDRIVKSILAAFKTLNQQNQWESYQVTLGKKSFVESIQTRRMPLFHGRSQFLCQSELQPLFSIKDSIEFRPEPTKEIKAPAKDIESRISMKLPSMSRLPQSEEKIQQKEDTLKQERQMNDALQKVGMIKSAGIKIQKLQNGSTVKRVTFYIPNGIKLSQIESAKKDLQAELGLKNISIVQGDEPGTAAITIPKEKRDTVLLRDLIDTPEFKEFASKCGLPFVIGADEVGEPIMHNLQKMPHLLIVGATGSGKSMFLTGLLLTLLLTKTPQELRMYLIDPKRVELSMFNGFPHVADIITDPKKAATLLQSLVVEMESRYEKFQQAGVRNIEQYNAKAKEKLDFIVCAIDEFADLMMTSKAIVEDCLIRLAALARASGIHLIFATQRPSVDVITGVMKNNLPSRIVFTLSGAADYRTALDKKPTFDLLGKGDGVARIDGVQGLTRFQGAMISQDENEIDEIIEGIADEWNGKVIPVKNQLPEVEEEQNEPEVELTPLEKAKIFICETQDTRTRSLREHLGMRNQQVKEIFDQLVEEGWLIAPDKPRDGYKLNLTEEELEEFLNQYH
jgi:S-DNA-T family DNA segregation ATPase FtsK/SpoIIIE